MKPVTSGLILLAVTATSAPFLQASQQSTTNGIIEDSQLKVLNRNIYMNRDFKNGDRSASGHSYLEEWAHGLITTYSSGFTPGSVGFGVDAFDFLGVKLDSGDGRVGTGLLERKKNGDPKDEYSVAGAAIKFQVSNTVLRYGDQLPSLPIFAISDTRLLPESASGALITSNEIKNLGLNLGHFTAMRNRNQTSRDSKNLKSIDFFGGTYRFTEQLASTLYWSETEDYYRRSYANANYSLPVSSDKRFLFDLGMYDTKSVGAAVERAWDGDKLDNQLFSLSAAYKFGAHTIALSHQRVKGDGGYVYELGSSTMYAVHSIQVSDFNQEGEQSWGIRYDLDMEAYGVPGLNYMMRYVRGSGFTNKNTDNGKEWERNIEVKYVVQSGPMKNMSARVRWATLRSSDIDNWNLEDVRLIFEYPINVF
ncbi:OprD family porin [Pseudomonas sp. MWU12-2345]|uniref:OprD family porin n=1 Tax=Pseudomonas sp. MWU12-2345 TaxID=2928689 RepID=UPI002010C5CC|nr:OprD family porin [Pseudomonas sp. MWU12-2345]